MPKVVKIESAKALPLLAGSLTCLKVAAYARVSTDQDAQMSSFEAQKDYYEKLIGSHPGWTLVGIYADRGISGTSSEKRPEFNRMLQDCRDGKIQMILTKSVSRFARNTVDSLNAIRELKKLGIGVQFEKENIFTLDSKGEFLITLMSSLSQEESRSISENVRWGMRKRMADGKYSVRYDEFLGYDRGKDGGFVVNREQARIVKTIFRLFLCGYSLKGIATILMENGVQTASGNERWYAATVLDKIKNESYKGDKLLQKTFVSDFLTKKQTRNTGQLQKFYVTGCHEAIIEPSLFDHAQKLLSDRRENEHGYSGVDALSGKLVCGLCGNYYGPRPWHCTDRVWQCREKAKKGCTCHNAHIYDYALKVQLKEVMMKVLQKDTVSCCAALVRQMVTDESRKEKAFLYLASFAERNPEDLMDGGDDFLLTVERITVFPDSMEVKLLSGQIIKHGLRTYSPKRGWRD